MQTTQNNLFSTERELVTSQQPLVYQNPPQAQPQQQYYQQQYQPQYGQQPQQMMPQQPQQPQQMMPQQMMPQQMPPQMQVQQPQMASQYPSSADGQRAPIMIQCPYCKQVGTTRVTHVVGNKGYIYGCLLCFTFPCLFWLPCVVEGCKRAESFCSHCGKQVGFAD